jgi:hypothetical protein
MVAISPSPDDLDVLAQERLEDAQALLAAGRFAGVRICDGDEVEVADLQVT